MFFAATRTFYSHTIYGEKHQARLTSTYTGKQGVILRQTKRVKIASNAKRIHSRAFQRFTQLRYVDFKRAVRLQSICQDAFFNCHNLTEVHFPRALQTIEMGAFYECRRLRRVRLNADLQEIGNRAFEGCILLEEIDLASAEHLASIGSEAFCCCKSLKSVIIPPKIEAINCGTFRHCSKLSEVRFDATEELRDIYFDAFFGCDLLRNIVLPSTIQYFNHPFDKHHIRNIEIDGRNLALAIRLFLWYPNSCPKISKDWLIYQLSFVRVQKANLLFPREDKAEMKLINELNQEHIESINTLVHYCVGRGSI
eukprot:scaffold11571_cov122-Cylindrotheca_fusiformis.AAC.15